MTEAHYDKAATGITGFDTLTHGGLPRGRVTVVLGGAGAGKTLFGLQVLVAGARAGEHGLFVAFEQPPDQVLADVGRLDWDLAALGDAVGYLDAQLAQTVTVGGEFDLLGLLASVGARARQLGATRIVFDGLDVLLAHLAAPSLVRREVFRLREWALEAGLTAIITAKAEVLAGGATRDPDDLQYLADCVVSLEHRVRDGSAIRLLRVAKYRGEAHSADELPFTIGHAGLELSRGLDANLDHQVFTERVTSGVGPLDAMLDGGLYRGSSTLITGAPGSAKTSLASAFAAAACARGEPTVYVSFDEAPAQIIRNMRSIGIELGAPAAAGTLSMVSLRARADNAEAHVARLRHLLEDTGARNLIVDPLSALAEGEDDAIGQRAALQVFDLAKRLGITLVSTSLLATSAALSEETLLGISTIADTWMHVSNLSHAGERNRALTIVKSRGTNHSNQVRELVLASTGITLREPYLVGGEVLMGTLRWERETEARHAAQEAAAAFEVQRARAERAVADTRLQLEALRTEHALREAELAKLRATQEAALAGAHADTLQRASLRGPATGSR